MQENPNNLQPEVLADTKVTVESIVPVPVGDKDDGGELFALEVKGVELDKAKILNRGLAQDIEDRRSWGGRVFWMLVGWLLGVLAVLILQGFGIRGFHLETSIVITFVTTTTVNVLSLGYIVAHYLFPNPPHNSN